MLGAVRDALAKAGADMLRLAAAPWLERRCRRCLVAGRGVPFSHGLCPACDGSTESGEPAREADLEDRLSEAVLEAVDRQPADARRYDAIVLNSGGKDSLYMLTRLRRTFPRLRLLSVSFDNGFLNALSVRNIEKICAAERVDSMIVRPPIEIYRELIRHGITRSSEVGCYRVDCMDGAVFRDAASRLAVEYGIPLVFAGHTWAQTRLILEIDDFRLPKGYLATDRTDYFGIPVAAVFPKSGDHIWNGSAVDPVRLPTWLFPLHLWQPTQKEIEALLRGTGFAADRVKQYSTGNALQAVFLLHDYRYRRHFSYEPEVALMLRAALVDRAEWRRIYALMEIAARSRRLTRWLAAPALDRLGLSFEELFPRREAVGRAGESPRPAAPDPRCGAPH